ncbi:ABC transporter permease [Microbacterium sp. YY-01]|uniref:ABC transporter permease n=1 Tax=Microbacterium sp. YY-01 TaxID=3421634 RepID=UPI003D17BFFB
MTATSATPVTASTTITARTARERTHGTRPPRAFTLATGIRISGQVAVVLAILGLVQWLVDSGRVAPIYLASPTQVIARFPVLLTEHNLLQHTGITLWAGLVGTTLGIVVGVGLGIWLGLSRGAEKFFSPFVSAIYAIPKVTLIPLLTLYLGIGIDHKIAVVFLFSVFVPLFNTISGIKNVEEKHLKVARSYGARRAQIIRTVILPSAAASIVTAIRIETAGIVVITIFAEMIASQGGIGYLVQRAVGLYDTPSLFALIIYVTLIAVALISIVNALERRFLLRWQR